MTLLLSPCCPNAGFDKSAQGWGVSDTRPTSLVRLVFGMVFGWLSSGAFFFWRIICIHKKAKSTQHHHVLKSCSPAFERGSTVNAARYLVSAPPEGGAAQVPALGF